MITGIVLLSLIALSGAEVQEIWFTKTLDYLTFKNCSGLEKTSSTGDFNTCADSKASNSFYGNGASEASAKWPQSLGQDLEKVVSCMHTITDAKCLLKSEATFFETTKQFLSNQRDFIYANADSVDTDKETGRSCGKKPNIDVATQCFSKTINKYDWMGWPLNWEDGQMCKFVNDLRSCEMSEYSTCSMSLKKFMENFWAEGFKATTCEITPVTQATPTHRYYKSSFDYSKYLSGGGMNGGAMPASGKPGGEKTGGSVNGGAMPARGKPSSGKPGGEKTGGQVNAGADDKSNDYSKYLDKSNAAGTKPAAKEDKKEDIKDDKKAEGGDGADGAFDWSKYVASNQKPAEGASSVGAGGDNKAADYSKYTSGKSVKSWYQNRRRNQDELEREMMERERENDERNEEDKREHRQQRQQRQQEMDEMNEEDMMGEKMVKPKYQRKSKKSDEWSEEEQEMEERRREKEEERLEKEREEAEEEREREQEMEEEEREKEMERKEREREMAEEERERRLEEEEEEREREQEAIERKRELKRQRQEQRREDRRERLRSSLEKEVKEQESTAREKEEAAEKKGRAFNFWN